MQSDQSRATLEIEIFGDNTPPEMIEVSGEVVTSLKPNRVGTFDTEMLSMSLTGQSSRGPVQIGLQPKRPTRGSGGPNPDTGQIDSFFDVFFDLTVSPPGQNP